IQRDGLPLLKSNGFPVAVNESKRFINHIAAVSISRQDGAGITPGRGWRRQDPTNMRSFPEVVMGGKHVAVLMGGFSSERPVSLSSGNACVAALEGEGYRVTQIDVGRDVAAVLSDLRPDVA